MEGLLEMTFRPSQHNVRFRSVFGSISGGFWDHFREVFGHTSGSQGVLKFSSFSVAHFDAFRVHLGSPTAPMLAPFSGLWGGELKALPSLVATLFFYYLGSRKWSQNRPDGAILAPKMVPKSTRWRHLGYYCYYCYCGYY